MDVCDKKRGRYDAIVNFFHSAAAIAHKEAKARDEREEERYYHDQPKSHSDCRGCLYQRGRGHCLSEMRPRTSRFQHRIRTDHALPWIEPRQDTVYPDQSVPRRSRRPWRVEEYQPYRRWKFSEWFWWPRNTLRTRHWRTGSIHIPSTIGRPKCKAQMQALAANPAWAQEQCAKRQLLHQRYQHLSISTAARGVVDNGSLASASR